MGVLVVDDPLKKIVWNDGAYMVIASTITYLRLKGGSHNVARDSMSRFLSRVVTILMGVSKEIYRKYVTTASLNLVAVNFSAGSLKAPHFKVGCTPN